MVCNREMGYVFVRQCFQLSLSRMETASRTRVSALTRAESLFRNASASLSGVHEVCMQQLCFVLLYSHPSLTSSQPLPEGT